VFFAFVFDVIVLYYYFVILAVTTVNCQYYFSINAKNVFGYFTLVKNQNESSY